MTKSKRITVRGRQRSDIDTALFVQILIAIGLDLDTPNELPPSPDTFDAAIEDLGGTS